MRQRGVSIIELLVVMGIVMSVLGLSVGYVAHFRSGSALRVGSQVVVAALHQARTLAVTEHVAHGVALDIASSRIRVFRRPDESTRVAVSQSYQLPRGAVIDSTNFTPDSHADINMPVVLFGVSGTAQNGSIWLRSTEGSYYTITVVAPTGRARVYNYQH